MDCAVQLIGGPCGQHGPYTFYRAFRYTKDGTRRVMTLSEFFFVKLWLDSDLVCIGELQLLWFDKNSEQVLASLRLYFLPENTPEGRMDHGEDEVLAISEKVVLRVEDLITWITIDAEWSWGRLGKTVDQVSEGKIAEETSPISTNLGEGLLDLTDIEAEKKSMLTDSKYNDKAPSVVILSYPRYCRYRAMLKRLEGVEDAFLKMKIVNALGGFSVPSQNTRILFCRDTFDYPELEGHEMLCNHLAPKLKGRPRGRRKKRSISPGSESNESESSMYSANVIQPSTSGVKSIHHDEFANGARSTGSISTRRSTRSADNSDGKAFLKKLTAFMKTNQTPIGRIPSLGYKELDLYAFYTKVQKLGGYDSVTANRIWKSIFEDMGGNHTSTSAATVIRRHYERFLLAYERHIKGEEYKPLPVSARRRLKSKTSRTSTSDADTSEGTSGSEPSTPIVTTPLESNSSNVEPIKEPIISEKGKTSSLRSVRVKSERAKEARKDIIAILNKPPEFDVDSEKEMAVKEEVKSVLIEKNVEPITSAATPVQFKVQDKSPSPVESKEIPIFETKDPSPKNELEIIEIPVAKSPEIIDLESDVYKNISSNNNSIVNNNNNISSVRNTNLNSTVGGDSNEVIGDVKKQKLDILKQGGLEVTPVRKEVRPSVIQQVTPHRVEIIRNNAVVTTVNKALNDRKQMPPPTMNPKRTEHGKSFQERRFVNGHNPPKVVQSKSIYIPSEKTIYGDPKDLFQPTIQQVQAPIFPEATRPVTGGGILDLTVKSPQKPMVEPSQVPHVPYGFADGELSSLYARTQLPLDGRKLNANLEITLVGKTPAKQQAVAPVFQKPSIVPRKRTFSENYLSSNGAKIPRTDERPRSAIGLGKKDFEPAIQHSGNFASIGATMKEMPCKIPVPPRVQAPQPPLHYNGNQVVFPHLPSAKLAPPYVPDMQLMYQSMLNTYLPMYRMPNSDYLQLYHDILAHNSRIRVPFPFTPESDGQKK